MSEPMSAGEALAAGNRALTRGAWERAGACFASVLEHAEHPAALEGMSWVHWWQEDIEACLAARERAYRSYLAAGDRRGAARMALWAGDDHLWHRGALALANGWFARARRLLEDVEECPEHGWQAVFDAHVALEDGDLEAARRRAGAAQRLGRRLGVVGLEMFAVATEGMVCLELGDPAQGMRLLDESATAALAGEYEELAPAAWACCLLLSACEQRRDDERGGQWSQQILAFSGRIGARVVVGNCRSHHGLVLARRGRWSDAERELVAAERTLRRGPAPWRQDALARLGELRRRQGRDADARRAFERAGEHWLAQAGLAALRLDEGDADGAVDLAERVLRQLPPDSPRRADALELAVRARLARGEVDAASGWARELREIAETTATAALRAMARRCEAHLASASHDDASASEQYADAVAAFERAGAPLEAAQARLDLARSLVTHAGAGLAITEARRARAALVDLGAHPQARRAAALTDELAGVADTPEPSALTPRQVEVLRLAAEGLTERGIAERLVLSEHTVHRHLANIYTRLACSSRAEAVAQAGRRGLL